MTFLINQTIFVLINTLNAGNDALKIKAHKPVDHFLNGLAYILSIIVFILIFKMEWYEVILFTISCFCNRQLFFDIPLNLLRKLKWDYVSEKPESWVDKIEKRMFGNNGRTPNYIYLTSFIVIILLNLLIIQ
jgi:hypothetical protein